VRRLHQRGRGGRKNEGEERGGEGPEEVKWPSNFGGGWKPANNEKGAEVVC